MIQRIIPVCIALCLIAPWSTAARRERTRTLVSKTSIFDLLDRRESDVMRRYGPAERIGGCLCYSDGVAFATFCPDDDDEKQRMWRVTISAASCAHARRSRVPVADVSTPHGVHLGAALDVLLSREGHDFLKITPAELARHPQGPLTAAELEHLGAVEYQFSRRGEPVLSVFVREEVVSGFAAWIPDSK